MSGNFKPYAGRWSYYAVDSPTGDPAAVDDYLGELLERETTEVRTEIVTLFRRLPGALGSGGIMIV
jgi:hypothetical protein